MQLTDSFSKYPNPAPRRNFSLLYYEALLTAEGFGSQYPNLIFNNVMINTRGLIVVCPIFGAAAAPEIAIAVPKFI
jgi:hypothetical protein